VGGGIVGGVTAASGAKVEEQVAAVSRSLSARTIPDDLIDRVAATDREQTSGTFTVLAERGPRRLSGRAHLREKRALDARAHRRDAAGERHPLSLLDDPRSVDVPPEATTAS
jgi:hypothetical protein